MLKNTRKKAVGDGPVEDTLPKRRTPGRRHLQRDDISAAAEDYKLIRVRWLFWKQGKIILDFVPNMR